MRTLLAVACAAAIARPAVAAAPPEIDGEYESPLGRVRVQGRGASFRGVLVTAAGVCGFRRGEEVLRATLLDDSLAGQFRVCLTGRRCRARDEWSSAVLLATGDRLSGAAHVRTKGCKAPLGKNGGLVLVRVATATSARSERTAAEPRAAKDRARDVLRDGARWLREGNFEAARRRFLEAIDVDPTVPEAYNGVGVTYRMRNDLARALEWYKKALAVDPDFGDAYYNMACVYALEDRKEMALRYLQIAALNGYASAEGIDGDPDLAGVRETPAYRALVRARM